MRRRPMFIALAVALVAAALAGAAPALAITGGQRDTVGLPRFDGQGWWLGQATCSMTSSGVVVSYSSGVW